MFFEQRFIYIQQGTAWGLGFKNRGFRHIGSIVNNRQSTVWGYQNGGFCNFRELLNCLFFRLLNLVLNHDLCLIFNRELISMADWSLCLRGLRGTYTSLIRLQHTLARQSLSWLLPRLFPMVQVHLSEPYVSQTSNQMSKFLLAWSNLVHLLDRIVHKFLDRLHQVLIDFFKFLDLRLKMVHSS